MAENRKYDLEDRLIEFAALIIQVTECLSNSKAGSYISGQIVRSGTSPALHYGEAQSAESRNDFIHKLKILSKELRETHAALKLITRVGLCDKPDLIVSALKECNELISIFVKSIETARNNLSKKKE